MEGKVPIVRRGGDDIDDSGSGEGRNDDDDDSNGREGAMGATIDTGERW